MEGDETHKAKQLTGSEAWPASFPKGIGFTTIRYLRSYEGFYEAKAGDYDAAVRVVLQCLRLKKGESNPTPEMLEAVCMSVGCNLAWLADGNGEMITAKKHA